MTLTTRAYTRWEDFRARFEKVLSSFAPIYLPPFFSRIGLRYIDAINKDALGLHELNWSELLRIPMLGMLGINDGEGIQTTHCIQQSELALDDFRTMVIRTGLGTISGDANQVFIIDTDTFIARDTVLDEVPDSLDALHEPVSRYFRWAVTDTLHSAMEPRRLEG